MRFGSQSKVHGTVQNEHSTISIWDTGIVYGQYCYDNTAYNNAYTLSQELNDVEATDPVQGTVTRMRNQRIPKWGDFTKSTTFHGVRYVFAHGHNPFRR
jgi:hypothetical protein